MKASVAVSNPLFPCSAFQCWTSLDITTTGFIFMLFISASIHIQLENRVFHIIRPFASSQLAPTPKTITVQFPFKCFYFVNAYLPPLFSFNQHALTICLKEVIQFNICNETVEFCLTHIYSVYRVKRQGWNFIVQTNWWLMSSSFFDDDDFMMNVSFVHSMRLGLLQQNCHWCRN